MSGWKKAPGGSSWIGAIGFGSGSEATDLEIFLTRHRLEASDIPPKKQKAVAIAVGEWAHQLRAARRFQFGYAVAQPLAPIAAATATVLAAFPSTRVWAVIPAAVATVAATVLAAYRFRETSQRRILVRHELGQEIVEFILGFGDYRVLSDDEQIDRLIAKVRNATMAVVEPEG